MRAIHFVDLNMKVDLHELYEAVGLASEDDMRDFDIIVEPSTNHVLKVIKSIIKGKQLSNSDIDESGMSLLSIGVWPIFKFKKESIVKLKYKDILADNSKMNYQGLCLTFVPRYVVTDERELSQLEAIDDKEEAQIWKEKLMDMETTLQYWTLYDELVNRIQVKFCLVHHEQKLHQQLPPGCHAIQ